MIPADVDVLNRQRLVARLLPATVHDARNSLQGISGTTELVTMDLASGGRHSHDRVRSILMQTQWVGERLEQLLKVGLESSIHAERLDVGRVCARAIDFRTSSWGRQKISAVTPPHGLTMHADFMATVRVLLNLIINAETSLLKSGGGVITFTAEVVDQTMVIVVDDDGGGVPIDDAPWLFTTSTSADRLATGLVAARQLAERMGGTLTWLGPDRRAAFALTLPVRSGG